MPKRPKGVSRRVFMKTLGSAAMYYPLANLVARQMIDANAAGSEPPLRLILIMNKHGYSKDFWRPKAPAGTPSGAQEYLLTESSFDYPNAILAPLARHHSKLLIPAGLDFKVLYDNGSHGHEGGPASCFTGTSTRLVDGWDTYAKGPSLDQVLAEQFGGDTRRRSLELAVQSDNLFAYEAFIYGPGGTRKPTIADPRSTHTRLFADFIPDPSAGLVRAGRISVLNYLKDSVAGLRSRLPGGERLKLDRHLEALAEIERNLAEAPTLGCAIPPFPPRLWSDFSPGQFWLGDPEINHTTHAIYHGEHANFIAKTQIDLLAESFACDLTRFASLNLNTVSDDSTWMYVPEDSDFGDIHNNLAHQISAGSTSRTQNIKLAQFHQWFAERIAYLMDRLEAIPEGDGTVLDNTLIVWGSEFGDPAAHTNTDIPFLLAGGAGGRLRMGRFIRYSSLPHNQLLTAIQNAFGIQQNYFNDPDYTGALPGIIT